MAPDTIDDDPHLFMGSGHSRVLLMVTPELQAWVSAEMGKQSSIDKEQCKPREERSLLRAAAKTKAAPMGAWPARSLFLISVLLCF